MKAMKTKPQVEMDSRSAAPALSVEGVCRSAPGARWRKKGSRMEGLFGLFGGRGKRSSGHGSDASLALGAQQILSNITASFAAGRLTALVGADGAGKTTLMRVMAGILPTTAGSVRVFGEDLYADLARLQNNIGYMPQKFGLYEDLSVAENFALYADLFGLDEAVRRERTRELLAMTNLTDFTARAAGKLSGGMKQKLGLACALLNHPKILLLDEPSVGVDPLSRKELWEILRRNAAGEDMCVVVATTYMDEAALCDDVIVLEEGEVRLSGTPEDIAAYARGRTFRVAADRDGRSVRQLQAALLDAEDLVLDAVPEAEGVRVLLMPEASVEALESRFPDVAVAARKATLEDGYLQKRCALLGRPSYARIISSSLSFGNSFTSAKPPEGKQTDGSPDGTPVEAASPVIVARDLVRRFGAFTAVDKTSFAVREGEIFGLLGPNGAGKTTTFKMLCGLIEVTEGELSVAGVDLRGSRALARERLGYMSQKFSLYAGLTVRQNFEFFAGAFSLTGKTARERIALLAQTFGLSGQMEREAGSLSGGYKQRLAMAVALINRPRILFLDEPTSGADIPTRRQFWRWISALAEAGTTIVVTTHFMEEALYCDRILIQDAGRPLVLGTPGLVRGQSPTMNEAFVRIVTKAREEIAGETGGAP